MKNRGFTLTELLGVIVILGVLAAITIPIIDNSLNNSKDNLYKTQVAQIEKGAKDYYSENLDKLPASGSAPAITLKFLQDEGYLPLNIKNPKTDKMVNTSSSTVVVTRSGGKYSYTVKIVDMS